MNFPVHILSETKDTGIRADIYHFENTMSRIYSENIVLCHLKGNLSITFENDTFNAPPCAMLFVPSGQTVLFDSSDAYVLMFFISDIALENRQFQIQLDSHTAPESTPYLPILSIVCRFLNPTVHQRTFHDLWKKKLCHELLYELLSSFCYFGTFQQSQNTPLISGADNKNSSADIPDTFSELLKFIDANYMENIQLKQLATSFYYTPSHLSKLFVHYTGQLFSDYLTQIRLSKALPLLLQTSMDIAQISDSCGFPNPRAFGQTFQKYYHTRPSTYRKQFYEQTADTHTAVNEHEWVELKNLGIFDAVSKYTEQLLLSATSAYLPCLQRHFGNVSLAQHGALTSVAHKNNILNIDFCRDLLMKDFQIQIQQLLKTFEYEYITLDRFLADDLQIYFSDNLNADFTFKERIKREITFDFTLYDQIFDFVETTGLKPIISLSYIPSFLAADSDYYDPTCHSCKCLPFSMTEWQTYVYTLFAHLKQNHSKLLSQARIFLWEIPDVVIEHQSTITENDYFELYTCTYRTIRSVLPHTAIDSPTISCTNSGFAFMKRFLNHCSIHHCLPDQLLFTYYHAESNGFHFPSSFLDCKNFFSTVQDHLKSHFPKKDFPLCMLKYSFAFGRNYYVDGLPGAMLPIVFSLSQSNTFSSLGMEKVSDYTTRIFFGNTQFTGTLSAITAHGGKKSTYYSLKFLQSLGDEIIINKPSCCLTKTSHKIIMLLYYNIPMNEWKHRFTPETLEAFYTDFQDMAFSITLSDFPFKEMILQEQSLTYDNGSAYETWVKSGWHLVTNADSTLRPKLSELPRYASEVFSLNEPVYTSFPMISNQKIKVADTDSYTYECHLKPFEIRLVEFIEI